VQIARARGLSAEDFLTFLRGKGFRNQGPSNQFAIDQLQPGDVLVVAVWQARGRDSRRTSAARIRLRSAR
jgi:hypothetical protein